VCEGGKGEVTKTLILEDDQEAVVLTRDQLVYLSDVLDMWIEGHEEATEQTITDPLFKDPEDMLKAVVGIKEQHHQAVEIRQRLWQLSHT